MINKSLPYFEANALAVASALPRAAAANVGRIQTDAAKDKGREPPEPEAKTEGKANSESTAKETNEATQKRSKRDG